MPLRPCPRDYVHSTNMHALLRPEREMKNNLQIHSLLPAMQRHVASIYMLHCAQEEATALCVCLECETKGKLNPFRMTNRARTPTQRRWPRFAGGAILRARLMEGPIERDLKRNYGSNAACGCVRVQPTSSMQSRFRRARIGSAPWGTMKALIVGLESGI